MDPLCLSLHFLWSACVGVNRKEILPAMLISRMKKDTEEWCGKKIRRKSRSTTQNMSRAGAASAWA